jgi:hypothetical protein
MDNYSEHLRARHVVIFPDNDQAGREHAQKIGQSLAGITTSIRVLELPGLPEKGDIIDWLENGAPPMNCGICWIQHPNGSLPWPLLILATPCGPFH